MISIRASTTGSSKAKGGKSQARSQIMRSIKSKNTKPELAVRRLLTQLGFRYRIHPRGVPGRPDIAFMRAKKAIFVNGCFWHQHQALHCKLRKYPKSNLRYWTPKLRRNSERDAEISANLSAAGWKSLVIWECQLNSAETLEKRLKRFLQDVRGKMLTRRPSAREGDQSVCG